MIEPRYWTPAEFVEHLKGKLVGKTIADVTWEQEEKHYPEFGLASAGEVHVRKLGLVLSDGNVLTTEVCWDDGFYEDIGVEVDGVNLLFEGSHHQTERKVDPGA